MNILRAHLLLGIGLVALAGKGMAQPGDYVEVVYVDVDAVTGAQDGSSWADAYTDLQDALLVAASDHEIRLAAGTYIPDMGSGNRTATFLIPAGVTLRGGYAGISEPDPHQRDIGLYVTSLSGDLAGDDGPSFANRADNTYHVVSVSGALDTSTVLDGLTIHGGHADGPGSADQSGGGIRGSVVSLVDVTIIDNSAEGYGGGASLGWATMTGCLFWWNRLVNPPLSGGGAGLYANGPISIEGSSFRENLIQDNGPSMHSTKGGAGLFYYAGWVGSVLTITDTEFVENAAANYVGGISGIGARIEGDGFVLTRCRFVGNIAHSDVNVAVGVGLRTWGPGLIEDCDFIGNVHDGDGGIGSGAFIMNPASLGRVVVSNTRFLRNTHSSSAGAGLVMLGSVTVQNSLFSGNEGKGAGALFARAYSPDDGIVENCTFSRNSAVTEAGGAHVSDGSVTFSNCILWGNSTGSWTGESAQISTYGSATAWVEYSCIQGLTGALGGVGNIGLDPLFVDADGLDDILGTEDDDLRLAAGSPCIDAGDKLAVSVDLADVDYDGDVAEVTPLDLDGTTRFADDLTVGDTGTGWAPMVDMGPTSLRPGITSALRWPAPTGGPSCGPMARWPGPIRWRCT